MHLQVKRAKREKIVYVLSFYTAYYYATERTLREVHWQKKISNYASQDRLPSRVIVQHERDTLLSKSENSYRIKDIRGFMICKYIITIHCQYIEFYLLRGK